MDPVSGYIGRGLEVTNGIGAWFHNLVWGAGKEPAGHIYLQFGVWSVGPVLLIICYWFSAFFLLSLLLYYVVFSVLFPADSFGN